MAELIKYGLSNVHIATWDTGTGSYSIPKAVNGAVSLELKPIENSFVAKREYGINYTISNQKKGYDGSIEFEHLPIFFLTEVLGYTYDDKNALCDISKQNNSLFALLFEIQTNEKPIRYVYYMCKCFNPDIKTKTKKDSINTNKDKFDIEIRPRFSDNMISKQTNLNTDTSVYHNWYDAVYM